MKTREDNERFAEQAKQLFDASVERLDGNTLSRLNQGRHTALEELPAARTAGLRTRWLPATGIVAVALVAVIVMRGPDTADTDPVTASDFELLLDAESLEMLEDLEFYSWLEAVDLDGNGNVG